MHQQIKLRYLCHFISSPLTLDAAVWWPAGKVMADTNNISYCAVITLFPFAEIINKVVLVMVVVFLLNKTSRVYAHIVLEVNEIYSSFKRDC